MRWSARSIPPSRWRPTSSIASRRCSVSDDVDGAAALLPDDLLDRFAFSGTPAQIAAQAEALFDAGAKRVEFGTPHGIDERAGVELLVREVVPRLR